MTSASTGAATSSGSHIGRVGWRVVVVWSGLALAVAVAVAVGTLVLLGLTWSDRVTPLSASRIQDGVLVIAFLGYSLVGALIVSRRSKNRVGWIFLGAGLTLQLWVISYWYATYGLVARPGTLPIAELTAWTSEWTVIVGIGLAFTFLLLVFPTGRLPSTKWRPVSWFAAFAVLIAGITWATSPGPLSGFGDVTNPVGIAAVGRLDLSGLGWVLTVLAVVASAVSLIVRYIRSAGVERRQIQWFAFAAAFMGLALVATSIASESEWGPIGLIGDVLFLLALVALPAAAYVAILKHDLYDLDIVVSRTITFGLLTALITGTYVAVVVGVGTLVGTAGEPNLALSVLATAIVAVAFQPARARVQGLANRLVYGERATPYEVLAEFSHRMGDAIDAEAVLPQMTRIVTDGTGAVTADVWLVVGSELHRVSSSSPHEQRRLTVPMAGEQIPVLPDKPQTVSIRHQGRLLGAITLVMPPGRALTRTENRLLTDLAAQAGLILSNVRLVEEVKASRQRIVSAQDQERRRIERDIHDGVQQRLVALSLALKMTATRVGHDPPEAVSESLDDAAAEARETLGDLRRLARGIHPAIITEGGLVAALESLAERAAVPVDLRVPDTGRLSGPVEVTVYYVVAEAITNAVKHAGASTVAVDLTSSDGQIVVEVVDDGSGGAVASPGSGLSGLEDRVAALGGHLQIDSPPGAGTRIRVDIPCESS
jgi:signal transduction histidine kinase